MPVKHAFVQPVLAAALIASLGLVAACKTPATVIDNPMDGDAVSLAMAQPLTVKLTDMDGAGSGWRLAASSPAALTPVSHKTVAGAAGSIPLDVFEFVAAAPGTQHLTFTYVAPGGTAKPDDAITVVATVHR